MSIFRWLVPFLLCLPTAVIAADSDVLAELEALKARLVELEGKLAEGNRKTEVLADEVQSAKLGSVIPEKAELKSQWGLGPAASSVYNTKQGLSIGSYGEATYRNFVSDEGDKKDQTDFLRAVAYLGYKFNDWVLFNSEIELEHGTTSEIGGDSGSSEGEVSVEFAYLDFLLDEAINARVGMMLVPMGFINEMHESPFYHGVARPEVEQRIIPSTWRENGFGFFGKLGDDIEYRTYLMNGLRASRFGASGVRSGRQKGNRSLIEDIAWTGRLDYTPSAAPGLLVGTSFWWGNSGQGEEFAGETPSVNTTIIDAHLQYHYRQFEFRALGAYTFIDDTELLNRELDTVIGEEQRGWYAELAYDVMPVIGGETTQYLAPFVRYETFDTHAKVADGFTADPGRDKIVFTAGLTYKPIPQVALKLDYRNIDNDGSSEDADEVSFGMGYAF
jgi:opacity protein-like surface antigen